MYDKLDEQLDIAPFLTKFANLGEERANFYRQVLTKLVERLFDLVRNCSRVRRKNAYLLHVERRLRTYN